MHILIYLLAYGLTFWPVFTGENIPVKHEFNTEIKCIGIQSGKATLT